MKVVWRLEIMLKMQKGIIIIFKPNMLLKVLLQEFPKEKTNGTDLDLGICLIIQVHIQKLTMSELYGNFGQILGLKIVILLSI